MQILNFVWIDWCIIGLITVSGLISLWRGLLREILSFTTWVCAVVCAWIFAKPVAEWADIFNLSYEVRYIIALTSIFLIIILIGSVCNHLISIAKLSITDRFFGIIFGLCRGLIVTTTLVYVLSHFPVNQRIWWQTSQLIPELISFAEWTKEKLSYDMTPDTHNQAPLKPAAKNSTQGSHVF